MNHRLLTRFVFSGMQKNKKTLVPFLIAGSVTVMIFNILRSLAFCPYIYQNHREAFYGAQTIAIMLEISSGIVGFFSILFLFYANQFVIKGRKREIGLYGVLGMSKGNITYIMLTESLIHAATCMILGIGAGTFLNKLMLLVLYKIIGQPPVEGILFSAKAFWDTLILFAVIFTACLIYNVSSIRVGNPVELLQSDRMGEKEPRVKLVPFFIGLVTLAAGYYLALSAKSVMEAINILFVSVLLVIIATYCLFTAGSIFILKVLKKNPGFYYKTRNFISVSNLMFRMKHNAAGLASICVLSTGIILLLTCGFSLMMLGEKNIDDRYPTDIKAEALVSGRAEGEELLSAVEKALAEADIPVSEEVYRQYKTLLVTKNGERQEYIEQGAVDVGSTIDTYLLTIADYNEYAGTDISLAEDEVLVYDTNRHWKEGEQLDFLGGQYRVAGEAGYKDVHYILNPTMSLFERQILVFSGEAAINTFVEKAGQSEEYEKYDAYIGYQLDGELDREKAARLTEAVGAAGLNLEISFKSEERVFFYNIYGGAFFVGIFMAGLFLMAAVMIIYYKQMSEGFEDQKRFEILANVGLTEKEAKKSIQTQVMILFFLPVCTAIVHMIVASNLIRQFLRMVLVVDALTFNAAIGVVCVIFLVVYALVYKVTSGEYYKIVNAK